MPSGSTLTVTGGTNMTQVVAGDTIGTADFNNMVANVYRQLGTPNDITLGTYTASNTWGYNQSTGSLNATSGSSIQAVDGTTGYKNLQDEIQALATFVGHSLNSSSASDKTAGSSLTASDWSNLMDDVKDVFDGRLNVPSGSLTTDSAGSSSRTTGWGSSGTPAIDQIFTLTFTSEAHCRAFFNAGGKVLFTGARSGGTSGSAAGTIGSQNANWTSLLSAMGTLTFDLNNLSSSGSTGTSASKGFYELSTSNQQLYIKYGSGAYASNYYRIEGKVNSTTNPTVLTFTITMRDDHALGDGIGADGIDGNSDDSVGYVDSVDGTISSTIQTKRANNGVVIAAPSFSNTNGL